MGKHTLISLITLKTLHHITPPNQPFSFIHNEEGEEATIALFSRHASAEVDVYLEYGKVVVRAE